MKESAKKTRFVVQAGIIAALYVVITLAFAPISYGEIQVRISEGLCILPMFTPAAIPGLFLGCFIANMFSISGMIWADVVFGTLATLCGAIGAYLLSKLPFKAALWLVPLPEVIFNVIAVPFVIKYGYGSDYGIMLIALFILIGQVISCYGIGVPLTLALKKIKNKVFSK